MRQVRLFIATSLDGFIASPDGGVDWLFTDGDYGYTDFYASIDTTLMGFKTYEKMLGFGTGFHYPDKTNYVFSRSHRRSDEHPVTFVSTDPAAFVSDLKQKGGTDIFLVGGGEINTILLDAGLIDQMDLFVHPIIIGEGIPLFAGTAKTQQFKLTGTKAFESGLTQLTYERP
jgi:dihydrofolate reductase